MARRITINVPRETVLRIIADEVSQGRYIRIGEPGSKQQFSPVRIGPNETVEIGPFNEARRYRLVSETGELDYETEFDGLDSISSEAVINALSAANLELVSPANNDEILIKDSSDSGKLKATTIQSLIDLIAAASGSTSAIKSTVTQTSHGLSVGNIVRLDATGNYIKAQADSEVNAEVIGIVSEVDDSNNFTITVQGKISGLSGLTTGSVYFLDSITAGTSTTIPPYLPDTVIKPLFVADSATSAFIQNYVGHNND